jgi:hypothetical protein
METSTITVGGDATAVAPESSYVCCDSCGADDELKEWIGVDGRMYHSCKPCWFDLHDTYEEIKLDPCSSCSDGEATHRIRQEDGSYLEMCEGCFLLDEQGGCDDCGSDTELTDEYQMEDGEIRNLCENCRPKFMEPLPKRQALQCNDCKATPATQTFLHLDGRKFDLCDSCWQLADHEEDYGVSFGSVPRLRVGGLVTFCACPVVFDDSSRTRCMVCRGILIVG